MPQSLKSEILLGVSLSVVVAVGAALPVGAVDHRASGADWDQLGERNITLPEN
jgi:hypothetical protein